jgi:hypothetical protein
MFWFYRVVALIGALTLLSPLEAVAAAPNVHLDLQEAVVTTVDGKTVLHALQGPVKHQDVLRYTIDAHNVGTRPAYQIVPAGEIPDQTIFVRVVSMPRNARVEYTLDHTAWSPHPMVLVTGKDGKPHRVPAPLSAYRGLHWIVDGAVPVHATLLFTYEVRVK